MDEQIVPGSVVTLKSGGPIMTVAGTAPSGIGLECNWFVGTQLESGFFSLESLEIAKEEKKVPSTAD